MKSLRCKIILGVLYMIDITNCELIASDFEGSERKFAIFYNGQTYMIKEPDPIREKNNQLSYMNNTFSEHIGCRIFSMLGMPVQETFLANYTRPDGKTEVVVACRDFRVAGQQLYEADKYAKSIIASKNISKPDFQEIEKIFERVEPQMTADSRQRFWDTFVVDALIGNKDRHLGNWGFLSKDKIHLELAPIYDCGSSLGALIDESKIQKCLEQPGIMSNTELNILARFKINGKSVTYKDMLLNPSPQLKKSIKNIVPKINLDKINELVDSIPKLPNNRKEFIKKSIAMRYEQILICALKKIQKQEKITENELHAQNTSNKYECVFVDKYNKALYKYGDLDLVAIKACKEVIKYGSDMVKAMMIMHALLPKAQEDSMYPMKIINKVREDAEIAKLIAHREKSRDKGQSR